jgi:dUTP pyrophosphatase
MFEIVDNKNRKYPNVDIKLPERKTKHSAGYDFYSNECRTLYPRRAFLHWTDVKVKLQPDEVLLVLPRSSIAIKRHIRLTNTIGVIDSDYYSNESNDGNIGISMYNFGYAPKRIKKGERIAQGLIINYRAFEEVAKVRNGGIGSTDFNDPESIAKSRKIYKIGTGKT